MNKERTTQEGRLLTLIPSGRPGYLPALAHPKDARCVFIFAFLYFQQDYSR